MDGGSNYLTYGSNMLTLYSKSANDLIGGNVKLPKIKAAGSFATKDTGFQVTLKDPCSVSALILTKSVADLRYEIGKDG